MAAPGNLIIDDIEQSLSCMTELGRRVAASPTEAVRAAVTSYACRRGWIVLPYRLYASWTRSVLAQDERKWLVLDPLLSIEDSGDRVRMIRISRRFEARTHLLGGHVVAPRALELLPTHGEVGIADDAAASGRTLRHLANLIANAGAKLSRVIVGASSREARATMYGQTRGLSWSDYYPGDWTIVHLRDGCPHLPFSGRPSDQSSVTGANGISVDLHVPSVAVAGNLWQVLALDATVRQSIRSAQSSIAHELGNYLGRCACVADLGLLGAGVPALVANSTSVTSETPLIGLLQ